MTQKAKAILFHWLFEFFGGLVIAGFGGVLIWLIPGDKQAAIDTGFYKGSASWAVVLIGVLFAANSVRRAIFKRRT